MTRKSKSAAAILGAASNEAEEIASNAPLEPQPTILDKIGQEVTVGCTIVYGHASPSSNSVRFFALGRCAALQLGKVLAIKVIPKKSQRWKRRTADGKHELNNVVTSRVSPFHYEEYDDADYRITVQGVDMNDNWHPDETPKLLRKGTLQFPSRMIVLDPANVPEKIRELLDTAR